MGGVTSMCVYTPSLASIFPQSHMLNLITELVFAVFCIYLATSVSIGIVKGNLLAQDGDFVVTRRSVATVLFMSVAGGALTALIGIGVEKILFLYVTYPSGPHRLSTLRGGIVSSVFGWRW